MGCRRRNFQSGTCVLQRASVLSTYSGSRRLYRIIGTCFLRRVATSMSVIHLERISEPYGIDSVEPGNFDQALRHALYDPLQDHKRYQMLVWTVTCI